MRLTLCVLLLAACGSDVAIEGMYQTTYETSNPQGCTEGPMMIQKPFFQIKKNEFLGQTVYTFEFCDSMDATTCTGALAGAVLSQSIDNGWRGVVSIASGSAGNCTLEYIVSSAVLTGSKLHAELKQYSDQVMLTDAQCTADEAGKRGTSLPCKSFDVVEGTRVR
jgi:hypothetical protein